MTTNDLGLGYASAIGLPSTDIRILIAGLLRSALGLVGILMVGQIIWSGFLMMTHGGNEDRRVKATSSLVNSIVGFVLIMSSASIARFVVDAVANAAGTRL